MKMGASAQKMNALQFESGPRRVIALLCSIV